MGLLQVAFLAAGIGTIIQTAVFMKMPISQGPSFVPLTAASGIVLASGGLQKGMATLLGALIVGAILLVLLGMSGVFYKIIQTLVPALVGGTIILAWDWSLTPTRVNTVIFFKLAATSTKI